ncbi:MAG TPA: glutamate mutase L [Candidatus Stackebrandtia faecavium]|nr:glutamate mutase L [Candidatus Stackebrandtia faecavium]
MTPTVQLCVDVGSTYTKVAAVDVDNGKLLAQATHHTTADSDVLDGIEAASKSVSDQIGASYELGRPLLCSSAGGGLRLGVVGNEPLVTATAAHRAGLSAGAKVVSVIAGELFDEDFDALARAELDVLLLAGGTDGGDATVLLTHAQQFAEAAARRAQLRVPVVMAGNAAVADEVAAHLAPHVADVGCVDNVLPRIGQLNPAPARHALREAFLRHVIAGKKLSASAEFAEMVRAATPDTVLTAVELLADGYGEIEGCGDLVVVDVGGATTDVYSVLTPDAELSGPRREVAGTAWRSRTVEGDLGLRHSAVGVVEAAHAEGLLDPTRDQGLAEAAQWRSTRPSWLPDDTQQAAIDLRLTELAIMVAMRRHARGERIGGPQTPLRGGKNLRAVELIVGSGGVLRNRPEGAAILARAAMSDNAGGYPLPDSARTVVDSAYVLGAAGLLVKDHPKAALTLMREHLWP